MGLWEKLKKRVITLKEEKKGWEDMVEIVEDVGPCLCFPDDFKSEEDILRIGFYNEFLKMNKKLYKEDSVKYWNQCSRYVEWEMQKYKYKLKIKAK